MEEALCLERIVGDGAYDGAYYQAVSAYRRAVGDASPYGIERYIQVNQSNDTSGPYIEQENKNKQKGFLTWRGMRDSIPIFFRAGGRKLR